MSDPKIPSKPSLIESLDKIQRIAELQAASVRRSEPLAAAEKIQLEIEGLRQDLKVVKEVHDLRVEYTRKLFWLIVAWLTVVVVFVALSASLNTYFHLSDSVLIAFITSTTVTVLGLFVLVAKWLFPSAHKDESASKKD